MNEIILVTTKEDVDDIHIYECASFFFFGRILPDIGRYLYVTRKSNIALAHPGRQ